MRVNTYEVDADGYEKQTATNVELHECFPDHGEDYFAAKRELERNGRYWGGGGAAPLFLLMLVRS